jgi:hypothetical protein
MAAGRVDSMSTKRISPSSAFLSTRISSNQRAMGMKGACTGRPARSRIAVAARGPQRSAGQQAQLGRQAVAMTMPQATPSPCNQAP